MLPIRRRFGGPLKLVDFVHGVRGTMLDGLYHAAYPFPLMVEAVRGRTMETDPIYQVYYGYQDFLVMKATHIPLPGTAHSTWRWFPACSRKAIRISVWKCSGARPRLRCTSATVPISMHRTR